MLSYLVVSDIMPMAESAPAMEQVEGKTGAESV